MHDTLKSYWLGIQYFTEKSVGKQLANLAGHWGMGLGFGSIVAFAIVEPVPIILLGATPGILRELAQLGKSGKPHILDRSRDIFENFLGSVTAFCVWEVLNHYYGWGGWLYSPTWT